MYSSNYLHQPMSYASGLLHLIRQPTVSLSALTIIIFSCMGIATFIIKAAHDDPVDSWRAQPAVLLALISSVVNICLGVLLSLSVATFWWRCATHGTTLKTLHLVWDRGLGLNFLSALLNSGSTRKVLLVATAVALVRFGNGPLLQRALRPGLRDFQYTMDLKINIAQQIPDGLFGNREFSEETGLQTRVSRSIRASEIVQSWRFNNTLDNGSADGIFKGYECPPNSTCTGVVKGAGIASNCSQTKMPFNLLDEGNVGSTIFSVLWMLSDSDNAPAIALTSVYMNETDSSCIGQLITEKCMLRAATVEYPIRLVGSTLHAEYDKMKGEPISFYDSPGDRYEVPESAPAGPLNGILATLAGFLYEDSTLQNPTTPGSKNIGILFWDPGLAYANNNTVCTALHHSPTEYLLRNVHDFSLRAAGLNQPDSNAQTFTANVITSTAVYKSDVRYIAAGLVIMFLGWLSVFILLWGWWELGEPVTLSPIETGKAFGAPILKGTTATVDVDEILDELGETMVKFQNGEVVRESVQLSSLDDVLLGYSSHDQLSVQEMRRRA